MSEKRLKMKKKQIVSAEELDSDLKELTPAQKKIILSKESYFKLNEKEKNLFIQTSNRTLGYSTPDLAIMFLEAKKKYEEE